MRACRVLTGVLCAALLSMMGLSSGDQKRTDAPARFLGHVSMDKPMYRAGERVFVRTVVLDADRHTPFSTISPGYATWSVSGPKGETLASGFAGIIDGVAGFAWDVPADAAGGQYTLTCSFPYDGFPPAQRKLEVRAYRAPRLKGEIVFLRDGFGPGDTVKASMHVERAEGGVPAGAAVNASAIVDGMSAYQGATKLDAAGNCSVELKLPSQMPTGDGTLTLAVSDGGAVEPISKTIPILLKTVDVHFYPEGGELIAWLPNRVYFEARTPAKKPADIRGRIVDSHGQAVGEVASEHEGRGRFTFTPHESSSYFLELLQPAGIDKRVPLPPVRPNGLVLTASQDVIDKSQPVMLQCASLTGGRYAITLSKHGTPIATGSIDLKPLKPAPVTLVVPAWADGALVATVRGERGRALAERLIFRRPARSLHVIASPDKSAYAPGDSTSLTVKTTDDEGKPVAATVGLSVTDSSVLEMPERRDRAPHLAEMVLLEDDVVDLEDSAVYFDPTNPKAATDIDLLLGTQGWRRFATEDEAKFLTQYGDAGRRALANRQPVRLRATGGFGGGGGGARFGGEAELEENGLAFAALADAAPARALPAGAPLPPVPFAGPWAKAATQPMRWPVGTDVRIYAHELWPDHEPGQRQDFTETLYWAAGVTTSAETGTARVSFKLSDAVTSFKVSADAFDKSGRLGQGSAIVRSAEPFYIEPKLPLEVTAGDTIELPIAAANGTAGELPVRIEISTDASLKAAKIEPFTLQPGGRERRMTGIEVGSHPGAAKIHVKAQAGPYSDEVTRELAVQPLGFPIEISRGGMLGPNARVIHTIEIPQSVVGGSVITHAAVYPTPLGNLTEALKRLMQEPYGCFEQTSSTTYPLVMADQYFLSHTGVDPQVIARSNQLLDKGYSRLIGFECKNKGYEWFGEDPGHECLSAYAVLEFTDMSAVRNVDQNMLGQTRKWLLTRRDGKGGFTHERRALHTWIADPNCANGYCTWALLEAGQKDLDSEVRWLTNAAATDNNSYVKALAANALCLAGDRESAKSFMEKLASRQQNDGHVAGATTSVVGSEGVSLDVETTSLAALAWLRDPAFTGQAMKAVQFLSTACQDGRYGSTQSTVLALRAIVAFDRARAHPTASGAVQLMVDGQGVGPAATFSADNRGAIELPDFAANLSPGKHEIELRMAEGSQMPYALDVRYSGITPASSENCKLEIAVNLKDDDLTEGSVTETRVTVTNCTGAAVPTPVAIVGLPGGLEVRHDQLKELVKANRIGAYEVRGREVILYWRDLNANERVEIPLSVVAAVPGQYTGPASRAYLYYADENKQWVQGMKVSIRSR